MGIHIKDEDYFNPAVYSYLSLAQLQKGMRFLQDAWYHKCMENSNLQADIKELQGKIKEMQYLLDSERDANNDLTDELLKYERR